MGTDYRHGCGRIKRRVFARFRGRFVLLTGAIGMVRQRDISTAFIKRLLR